MLLSDWLLQLESVLPKQAFAFLEQALGIWQAGGWAMYAIAAIALVMFTIGVNLFLRLNAKGFEFVSEKKWRGWIDNPAERQGPVGRLLNRFADAHDLDQAGVAFEEVQASEIKPFERELFIMRVCVAAAPLLGLLGTVTGMIATFDGLSTGSGGDQTKDMVASGISEALITTETGLVIALAGLFFQYQLTRKHQRYKAFLIHMKSVCTQNVFRKTQASGQVNNAPTPQPGH